MPAAISMIRSVNDVRSSERGVHVCQRAHLLQGNGWIRRSHHLANFLSEALATGSLTAYRERSGSLYVGRIAPELFHRNRPVHDGWRFLMHPIVVDIGNDADDLTPRCVRHLAHTLAERERRLTP